MRIIELLIDKLEELSGFDAVALVEEPAIEADFMAFNNKEIEDTIVFEVLKLAMKEQFVERRAGESKDDYIARCIPVLKDEGYGDDQAAAICYDALKLYEHEDDDNHEYKTLYVSVIKTDDGKKYVIDDTLLPELHLEIGKKYCLDQCDESNMEHPMRLSTTPDGIHNGGKAYLGEGVDEIEYELDKIHFCPNENTPKELYYYCTNHPGMGGMFKIVEKEIELDINVSSLPNYSNPLEDKEYEFETYNDYPESAVNAAKRALEWKDEHPDNDCGTRVGWARANQLANRRNISEDTIARMASFARHLQHEDVPYSEGCGGLMVDAWGGRAGIEWAKNKLERIRASKQSLKKSNVLLTKDKLELLEKQSDLNNTERYKFGIDEEQMKVIGAMLIPDKLILRIDEEGNPYYVYFSKDTVKAIAEKAMKNKLIDVVNLEHNPDHKVDAYMTQSWIKESDNDKSISYGMDVPDGTWLAEYKIEDDKVWNEIKNGTYKGFSIEGIFQNNIVNVK